MIAATVEYLLERVLSELPREVEQALLRGESLELLVYLVADISRSPGRNLFLSRLVATGCTPEQAQNGLRQASSISDAKKTPMTISMMLAVEQMDRLLDGWTSRDLDEIRAWLRKPVPPNEIRAVMVAGPDVDARNMRVTPRAGSTLH